VTTPERRMSAGKHTPTERAALALQKRDVMCDLLADCRTHGVPGWWDGSAFRSHPVGLIVGTIKFTNQWRTDNGCDIQITDGDGWDLRVCQDSWGGGSPHPKPINGSAVTVWERGSWRSDEFREALQARVLEILTSAAEHIETARQEKKRAAEAKAARAKEEADAAARQALSLARGEGA